MAEMLIDGVKLDACNTAEADAIRAKTGGTDPIPYDFANNKGFADAIAAIPSGGGDPYEKLIAVNNNTLTAFENDDVNIIRQYMFYGNTSLTSISGENIQRIGTYAFYGCTNLNIEINDTNFPALNYLEPRAFRNSSIRGVIKPHSNMSFGGVCFEACRALKIVDVNSFAYVEGNQNLLFYNCTAFDTFIIRRTDGVNSLGHLNYLSGTPFRNGNGGTLYVPSALVESYRNATNWSSIFADSANSILPIEGSEYEL